MKKIYKLIASGMFIGFFAIYLSEFVSDLQYQNKIPVKYLIDGTYEGSDTDFDYYKITDKTDEVAVSLKNETTTTVTIPESCTINDTTYTVTGIYRNAFSNKSIGSIYIPKTITTIDYEAFMNTQFTSNTKVEIPYSVEQLGTACFFKSNLTEIYFSDSVSQNITTCDVETTNTNSDDSSSTTTKSKLSTISDYCFAKCSSLKTVSFSTSLTTIKEHAFEYCSSITTLAFLSGLEYIGSNAFNYCSSLNLVYIPSLMANKQTVSIESFAFSNCDINLTFTVSCTSTTNIDNINEYWRRKNIFDDKKYAVKTQTSDVYANGLWLYEKDSNSNINILKFIGEIDSDGYLAFPNTIENSKVVSFNSDCLSGFENQIKYLFFSKYLTKIPDSYISNSFSKIIYVGCVDGDNCYTTPDQDYIIDLSKMEYLNVIGTSSFQNTNLKSNVTEIKLPQNLTSIGDSAFESYNNCEKLSFEKGRTNTNTFAIGSNAFRSLGSNKEANEATSDLVFPKELINIGSNAFERAKCIRSVKFEGGTDAKALTIYKEAFFDCSGLKSLIIEDRGEITTINEKAFGQWNGDYRDFSYKPSLQTAYLPSKITIQGTEPFSRQIRCTFYFNGSAPSTFKNQTYYFMNKYGAEEYETSGTDDITYNNEAFKLGFTYHCGIYENVSLEEVSSSKIYVLHTDDDFSYVLNKTYNTAVVSRYHFDMQNKANLTSETVTVPGIVTFDGKSYTITEIGTGAFGNSDSYNFSDKTTSESTYRTISKVILPTTIKKIGHYAFFRCVGLEEVGYQDSTDKLKMPTALESIGEMAFALSGIKYIDSLNSNCDFLFYGSDTSLLGYRYFSSPFLNCPQLEYISLTNTSNSKLQLLYNNLLLFSNFVPSNYLVILSF